MTDKEQRPKPPAHLAPDTRRWWSSVEQEFVLSEHHRRVLTLCATAWDRATQARQILAKEGLTFNDRFGRPMKHPAVSIEEQARRDFDKLLRSLDLEGEVSPHHRRKH